jgi:hypothetical protein
MIPTAILSISRNTDGRFKAVRANRPRSICICLSLKLVAQYSFHFFDNVRRLATARCAKFSRQVFKLDINLKTKIRSLP